MENVKYIGCSQLQSSWGGCDDPRKLLKIGRIYEVEKTEVHSWHTKLSLVGIEGKFNSACFETV